MALWKGINMKIRNGFVSNSSSSSFIIKGKIDDVANSMLNTVVEDYSDWNDTDSGFAKSKTRKNKSTYKKWLNNLKIALKNKDVQDGKIGITMPSCNYPTYVLRVGEEVYVSTANNHEWDYEAMGIRATSNSEADGEDPTYKKLKRKDFFNVRNRLIHGKPKWSKNYRKVCLKCGTNYGLYVVCNGKKLCDSCFAEIK